jgi:hypothetical protein
VSSVERLQDEIREHYGVRTVLPFGLPIEIGTVGVIEGGQFYHRGTVEGILGEQVGRVVSNSGEVDWEFTSGQNVTVNFLASGEASALFPGSPNASARVEIGFQSAESYLASIKRPAISTIAEPVRLLDAMVKSYVEYGNWRPEYVFINEVVTPQEAFILASRSSETKLLLEAQGVVAPVKLADLAGNVTLKYQNQDVVKFESANQAVFYNAYRVKNSFWTGLAQPAEFGLADLEAEDVYDVV